MLGATCLSVLVVALDLTILNIALPSISAALHASTGNLQWIVDAYSLAFAGVMLSAGLAGDRFGRKRLLLAGLAAFLGASVWCALSASPGELIAARAVMGLGAGIVLPLSLAVVSAAFSDAERTKAVGITIAVVAAGLPLGPVLGGVLLQHFSWHSVFWINVRNRVLARHDYRHAYLRRSHSPRRPRRHAVSAWPRRRTPVAAATRDRVPAGRYATMTL